MHPMQRIRVMIVDDHPLFRRGLRSMLEADRRLVIVGEAADGLAAIALADRLLPDVAVLDVNMPGMSGFEATRILKQHDPRVGGIIVSTHEDDEQPFHAT